MREKQPLAKKIKLLILFNPVLEWSEWLTFPFTSQKKIHRDTNG